ncbi:hypothetical protein THIOM_000301, partial [Candidatus Thiomargarita nelsonii]
MKHQDYKELAERMEADAFHRGCVDCPSGYKAVGGGTKGDFNFHADQPVDVKSV